jgi:hypothetical protein
VKKKKMGMEEEVVGLPGADLVHDFIAPLVDAIHATEDLNCQQEQRLCHKELLLLLLFLLNHLLVLNRITVSVQNNITE